jgi:hypothetical protein
VPRIYKKKNLFVAISGPRTYVKWTNSLAKNVKRDREKEFVWCSYVTIT